MTPISITTWNVNSVRQRLTHVLDFLNRHKPDLLCLQEIKCLDEAFPKEEIEAAGYTVVTYGQKTFNGVAILSRTQPEDVIRGLPGFEDGSARYLEAVIPAGGQMIRVACVYCPNGNPVESDKYPYKLDFMAALTRHAARLLKQEELLVLAGDYNIIPTHEDVHDPALWAKDALFLPQSRAWLQSLLHLGFSDAVRLCTDEAGLYTFWDYQAGCWPKNHGIRIDHLLLSPQAADRLVTTTIHKDERAKDKPSDHVPVTAFLTSYTL